MPKEFLRTDNLKGNAKWRFLHFLRQKLRVLK